MQFLIRLCWLCLLFAPALRAAPPDEDPVARMIGLRSGIHLQYVVQGRAGGPAIVLLHGGGDSWHSYQRVLPWLPSAYRVYAVTLRGHGLSDHPDHGYSRLDFAADILDLLDQLKIRHATLVGHSLGSFVAQTVAEQDQGRHLDRLVLISSGLGSLPKEARDAMSTLSAPLDDRQARDAQASTIYGWVPDWFFEIMVAEAQRVPAAAWHGIAQGLATEGTAEEFDRIRVPTLILWGDKDSLFGRAEQERLVKAIPHASLHVYANTGHALHWEHPRRFASDLLAFVTLVPGGEVP